MTLVLSLLAAAVLAQNDYETGSSFFTGLGNIDDEEVARRAAARVLALAEALTAY